MRRCGRQRCGHGLPLPAGRQHHHADLGAEPDACHDALHRPVRGRPFRWPRPTAFGHGCDRAGQRPDAHGAHRQHMRRPGCARRAGLPVLHGRAHVGGRPQPVPGGGARLGPDRGRRRRRRDLHGDPHGRLCLAWRARSAGARFGCLGVGRRHRVLEWWYLGRGRSAQRRALLAPELRQHGRRRWMPAVAACQRPLG